MRKAIFILLALMFTAVQAQMTRNLVITSSQGKKFKLSINHRLINRRARHTVKVVGLTDNYYDVQLKMAHSGKIIRTELYVPPLSEIIYDIRVHRGNLVNIAIVGISPLEAEEEIVYDNPFNYNDPIPEEVEEDMVAPVPEIEYQNMLRIIREQDFDDTRLETAENMIINHVLTVNQLRGILRLFDFDDKKLKLAKFAYPYVMDKENYYALVDVFDFESDKKKLNQFIREQG